jgi:hypothetical protein
MTGDVASDRQDGASHPVAERTALAQTYVRIYRILDSHRDHFPLAATTNGAAMFTASYIIMAAVVRARRLRTDG